MVVSLWATIEGLVANSEIHEVLFDEPDSLQMTTNLFLDDIVDRLSTVEPSTRFIVSNTINVLDSTVSIILKSYNVEQYVKEMDEKLEKLGTNALRNMDLTATVMNPFNSARSTSYSVPCAACKSVSDSSNPIKDKFNTVVSVALDAISETIIKFDPLQAAKHEIQSRSATLFQGLDQIIDIIRDQQVGIDMFFTTASDLDSQYREKWMAVFFGFTFLIVILPVLGMLCRTKWCFKANWCCAMWLGTLIMFITSFAALIIVVWGDFCVRLDDFEVNQVNSQFGETLGIDETTMELVNACLTGTSIIELYELDVFDWDYLRWDVKQHLTGRTKEALYFDELSVFRAEMDSLNIDAFTNYVDSYIDSANAVGSYCGCGAVNISFSRQNLLNPISECTDGSSSYWQWTVDRDGGKCRSHFVNASYAVQAEDQLSDEMQSVMNELKADALDVFQSYDTKIFPLGMELYDDLENISCTVDPLFDAIDEVVYNFSNCGFIGEYYGDIKETGCVLMFDRTFYIARALTVIAFISIVIVMFSFCMDYVYGPPAQKREEDDEQYKSVDDDEPMDGRGSTTVELWSGRKIIERGGSDTMEDSNEKLNGDYQRTSTMDTEEDDIGSSAHSAKREERAPGSGRYEYHYHDVIGGGLETDKEDKGLMEGTQSENKRMRIVRKSSETSVVRNGSDEETQNSSVNFDGNVPYIYPSTTEDHGDQHSR